MQFKVLKIWCFSLLSFVPFVVINLLMALAETQNDNALAAKNHLLSTNN